LTRDGPLSIIGFLLKRVVYVTATLPEIHFSDRAAHKVRDLIDGEGNDALKLRVFITGGGCSGFSYGFTFDEEIAEDDALIENAGVTMVVDSTSYQYLAGAEVDYREDLQGAQFVVQNPNASSTCGCGNSFSV
jgi:iron-sulfur cluster insertion protein